MKSQLLHFFSDVFKLRVTKYLVGQPTPHDDLRHFEATKESDFWDATYFNPTRRNMLTKLGLTNKFKKKISNKRKFPPKYFSA